MPEKQKSHKNDSNTKYYCLLHGCNKNHETNNCNTLKKDAAECKEDSKTKYVPKKINNNGQEIHTLIEFATKSMRDAKP